MCCHDILPYMLTTCLRDHFLVLNRMTFPCWLADGHCLLDSKFFVCTRENCRPGTGVDEHLFSFWIGECRRKLREMGMYECC